MVRKISKMMTTNNTLFSEVRSALGNKGWMVKIWRMDSKSTAPAMPIRVSDTTS